MAKRVGKYEVHEQLGAGAFSVVKVAIDTETGQSWAIKIVEKAKLHKDNLIDQLKREIALMKQLKHENIVELREVMQSHHYVYLVMELVAGGELFERIVQARRFDEPRARKYFQQIIFGIASCHRNGVAHRDLKPENILIDKNDVLKITDFGLSTWQPTSGEALLLTPCGTANYVAPEVLKETGYNGCKADIWSVGVILYVMLAGQRPFEDPQMNALFNKIERGEYRMGRFSPAACDLISKILVVDPNQRYTLEDIARHPWFTEGGVDQAKLSAAFGSNPIQTQQHDIDNAIAPAAGMSPAVSPSASPLHHDLSPPRSHAGASAAAAAGASATGAGGLDAFDIIARCCKNTGASNLPGAAAPNRGNVRRAFVAATLDELAGVVQSVMGLPPTVNRPTNPNASGEIKGLLSAPPLGLMTFSMLVTPTTLPGRFFVEVKKGRGDGNEYHNCVDNIFQHPSTKLLSQTVV